MRKTIKRLKKRIKKNKRLTKIGRISNELPRNLMYNNFREMRSKLKAANKMIRQLKRRSESGPPVAVLRARSSIIPKSTPKNKKGLGDGGSGEGIQRPQAVLDKQVCNTHTHTHTHTSRL